MPDAKTKARLRRVMKSTALAANALFRPRPWVNRVLTYHSIGRRDHEMNVPPEVFQAQMAWLAGNYPVITLEQALQGEQGVAVTFDDGYADNLYEAAPILHALGIPATVFVVAGAMGGRLSHDAVNEASRLLTWDEARRLRDFGVRIGSHGMTHRRLAQLAPQEQREEIEASRGAIEKHLGEAPAFFAYPFGTRSDYTEQTIRFIRDAGYCGAVTNRYGPNRKHAPSYQLGRINIDRSDNMSDFQNKLQGDLDFLVFKETCVGRQMRQWINRGS